MGSLRNLVRVTAAILASISEAAKAQVLDAEKLCDLSAIAVAQKRMAACTTMIESGNYPDEKLSNIFATRGRIRYLDSFMYLHGRKEGRESALADYEQALKLNPKNAMAYYFRGSVYIDDDTDRALADLNEANRLDPANVNSLFWRAFIYAKKNRYDLAMPDLDEALRIAPDDSFSLGLRSSVKRMLGDVAGAEIDDAKLRGLLARPK
jgi:tetratricopeptide (TPR) repeat protein